MARQLTAFDIGESMIKIVSVSGGQVKKVYCGPEPDGMVENGVVQYSSAMADSMKNALKQNGIPRGKAGVILPDNLVYARNVSVPPMTEVQLKYNLPFEFKDYLNQEKGQYFYDYAVQEIVKEDGSPKEMRLFACATLKRTIEQYRQLLKLAGCKLAVALPEEAAYGAVVANFIQKNPGAEEEDYCLVDVGHRGLRMYIYRGGEFRNRRTVDLGLENLERQISEEQGVDIHVAHTYLLTNYQDVQNSYNAQELYNRMAVEIMKSVNFYNYNNRDRSLRRICLCGGGAGLAPLREAVTQMNNLELMEISQLIPGTEALDNPWIYVRAIGCALQK